MRIDPLVAATFFAMGLVTYATRAGGILLMRRVGEWPLMQRWLRYVPGTVLVALVTPGVLGGGLPELGAGLVTVAVALKTRSLPLSMLVGVAAVLALRALLGTKA